MFERETARLISAEVNATDIRSALRQEVEAFAWDLISRLAGTDTAVDIDLDEIPLDRTLARG